jgi:hypothetical protein
MTESEKSGPPAGFETKNVPGSYTPAAVVSGDHPGHAVGFAGKPGYTNTPGIDDPAESADAKSTTKTSATKSTTAAPATK